MKNKQTNFERACEFFGGNSLYCVADKSCDNMHCDVDVFSLSCDLVSTCLKGYVNLWVEVHLGESPSCHVCWYLALSYLVHVEI